MLTPKARWKIPQGNEPLVRQLIEELGVEPLIARLLAVRGFRDTEEARLFLGPEHAHFHDPFLLAGMDKAVARIRSALDRGESIRIYGDYDADGVSSTSLMIWLLRRLEAKFDFYIPHRVQEGYGLNRSALDLAKQSGVSLIVTVDTGISAREEIAYAAELGIDVVVTDHHEPPELLPDKAVAVVDPKVPGCPYPYKGLAGAGVALKLAHALLGGVPDELLEIAAIGTVADLMPLTGENRLIVKLGLERMRETSYAGLRALFDVAGIDRRTVASSHVAFALAPRINASGRLNCADNAVRLLTTADSQEAERLAAALDALNKERQHIVDEMGKEAMQMIEELPERPNVIVLAKEDWNVGVIGIVASKVLDKYYAPTIILGIDPETGMAKGSARSIAGYDIHRALTLCSDLLDHFGGHQAAAGMSLSREKIPEFTARLNRLAEEWLTEEDKTPILQADLDCPLEDARIDVIRQLEKLAPFGMGNPAPRFVFKALNVQEKKTMGKDSQHLKLVIAKCAGAASGSIEAVGFGKGAALDRISGTASVDVLGELSLNEWNGVQRPQILIQDMRIEDVQIFDWRGSRDWPKRWRRLSENDPSRNGSPLKGIVVFASENSLMGTDSQLSPDSEEAIWHVRSKLGRFDALIPVTTAAKNGEFGEVGDLLLHTLPPDSETLEAVLAQARGVKRVYALLADDSHSGTTLPTRDMFKQIYASLQKAAEWGPEIDALTDGFARRSGMSPSLVRFILDVFADLGFIEQGGKGYRCAVRPAKRELETSDVYQARVKRRDVEQKLIYTSAQELADWMAGLLKGQNDNKNEIVNEHAKTEVSL